MNQSISPNAQPHLAGAQQVHIPQAASEGFKVTAKEAPVHDWGGRLKQALQRPGSVLRALLGALLCALLVELLIFNQTAVFFDEEAYPHQVVPLNHNEQLGLPAFIVSTQQNSISLTLPDLPVKSVYVRLAYGPRYLIDGKLELRTTSRAYAWSTVGNFKLSGSGRDDASEAYFKVLPKGEVKELRLSFDPRAVTTGVAIVALEINKPIPIDLSILRILLLTTALTFAWSVVKLSWRQGKVIVGSKRYRQITHSCLAIMILGAAALFYATSPYQATEGGFKFISNGYLPYSTPNHDLLVPLPQTPAEYEANDFYIQMLAAYTSGQLNLPYPADPRLEQVTNVYDNSELFAKQIPFLWDHAYYNGKYYVYFGLAPLLTIYYPIYLVTGEAPCAALAAFIATVYALLGLYFGVTRLIRTLLRQVNPLLLSLGFITLALASGIFMMQGMMVFYILPYQLGFAVLGLTLGCATKLFSLVRLDRIKSPAGRSVSGHIATNSGRSAAKSERGSAQKQRLARTDAQSREQDKARAAKGQAVSRKADQHRVGFRARTLKWERIQAYAELVVLGLAIVGMVTARPLNLLYQLIFLAPLLWFYLRSESALRTKLQAALCTGIPVLLGAIGVMWYNHARFDSIFEFGQFNQLTLFDTHYHELHLNFELFFSVLYHYFFENFNLIANFPYVTPVFGTDLNLGNGTGISERAGLLFFPFFWALPLLWILYRACKQARFTPSFMGLESCTSLRAQWRYRLVQGIILSVVAIPFLMIAVGINAGFCMRYLCDATMVWAPFAAIACVVLNFSDPSKQSVEHSQDDGAVHRAFIYWAVVAACLFTCGTMFFLTFSASDHFSSINPELMVELKRFFDPLSFT